MEARLEIVNLYHSIKKMTVNTEFTLRVLQVMSSYTENVTYECDPLCENRPLGVNTEFMLREFKVSYTMCASDTLERSQQVNP